MSSAGARSNGGLLKAVFTDSHFWLPVGVLVFGVAVLVALR